MTRRLIAIATAMFVTSSCAYAQIGGMSAPTPWMGTTSPLGMSTSGTAVAPTGIPLGAAPLATPGVTWARPMGLLPPPHVPAPAWVRVPAWEARPRCSIIVALES